MADEKSCAVGGCDEPVTANCASGRCFCATHSTCGMCSVVLANGELQRALLRAGGMWDEGRAVSLLKAKGRDARAAAKVNAAILRAIRRLSDDPKLRLLHSQGDGCGLPISLASTPVLRVSPEDLPESPLLA